MLIIGKIGFSYHDRYLCEDTASSRHKTVSISPSRRSSCYGLWMLLADLS